MVRRRLAAVPVALALVFPAGAQAAGGADPGVTFDPGSPSGKEYAIPIVQGRTDGSGTNDQRAAANTPFGAGIKPPGGGGGGGGKGGSSGHSRHGSGSKFTPAGPTGSTGGGTSPALRSRIGEAEDPGGTALWTVGIALAVLLGAGALFLGLRRGPEQAAS
jgi:hypothetical protein